MNLHLSTLWRHVGGIELRVQFRSFINKALYDSKWLISSPGRFTPRRDPLYSLNRRLGGPQHPCGHFEEIIFLSTSRDGTAHSPVPITTTFYQLPKSSVWIIKVEWKQSCALSSLRTKCMWGKTFFLYLFASHLYILFHHSAECPEIIIPLPFVSFRIRRQAIRNHRRPLKRFWNIKVQKYSINSRTARHFHDGSEFFGWNVQRCFTATKLSINQYYIEVWKMNWKKWRRLMIHFQVLLHDLREVIRHNREKSQSQVWKYTLCKDNSIIAL